MQSHMRPRSARRCLLLGASVLAGLALLSCSHDKTEPATQATAPAARPERSAEQATYDLLDALSSAPVTVELPPGFTALSVLDALRAAGGPYFPEPDPP